MFMIVGLIIGSAINGLLVGLVVMLAGKMVLKEAPYFSEAFKACFYAALVGSFVRFVLMLAMADSPVLLTLGISLLATYVIYVVLFQTIMGYTMGQAIAVAAVAVGVMIGLIFAVSFVFAIAAA